jgi:hypothetical protein
LLWCGYPGLPLRHVAYETPNALLERETDILAEGRKKAQARAVATIREVRETLKI